MYIICAHITATIGYSNYRLKTYEITDHTIDNGELQLNRTKFVDDS